MHCSDQQKIIVENSKLKNSGFRRDASQYLPVHFNYHCIIINFYCNYQVYLSFQNSRPKLLSWSSTVCNVFTLSLFKLIMT